MASSLTGEAIALKAEEYIGTPYREDGRIKGVGVDCAGLAVCVLGELGIEVVDALGLSSASDVYSQLLDRVGKVAFRVDAEPEAGDLLVFRAGSIFNHLAICARDGEMVHALNHGAISRVVKHPIGHWRKRLRHVYRLNCLGGD